MYKIYREQDGVQLEAVVVEDWDEAQTIYKTLYKNYLSQGFTGNKVSDNEYRLNTPKNTARLRIALKR